MADIINDSGNYDKDATLTGTYTIDATNNTLTMGADGQADTGFVLPTDTHILVETYDIDGVSGALGRTWFRRSTDGIDAYLASCQGDVKADVTASKYSTYKMKATLYNGDSTADVYEASETVDFPTTPDSSGISYTPSAATWKITDTLTAPEYTISFGPEILTNSTFDSDTAGWSSPAYGTLVWQTGGEVKYTRGSDPDFTANSATISLEAGKTYRHKIVITEATGGIKIYCNESAAGFSSEFTTVGEHYVDFTASTTGNYLIRAYAIGVEGQYTQYTEHSLKEVL